MNKKIGLLAATGIIAAAWAQALDAFAHMEPKADDGMEKCYGVAKAHKNDCAGNKHSCATMAMMDASPNEWVKTPKGLCDKLMGGATKAKDDK